MSRRVFVSRVVLTLICFFTIALVSLPTNASAHVPHPTTRSTAKWVTGVQTSGLTNEQNIHVMADQNFSKNWPRGMGATFGQYQPHVGSNDVGQPFAAESIAQLAVLNDNSHPTADLEFGWMVAPQHYGDAFPHMFVLTR